MPSRRLRRGRSLDAATVLVLVGGAIAMLFPLLWTLSTSLKEGPQVFAYPPRLLPRPIVWREYLDIWTVVPFAVFFRNSIIVTLLATFGQVLSTSLVAFGFARFRFPGRDILFLLCLSMLMIPPHVTVIPQFLLFKRLHWLDTFLPLIVPYFLSYSAFSVFLFRQFFLMIPRELDEAAKIDGASPLLIFWRIVMPLSLPVVATVAILSFHYHWNSFLHPLIFLNSMDKLTLPVGLRLLRGSSFSGFEKVQLLMAGSILAMAPLIAVFVAAQRFYLRSVSLSGFRG